MELIRVAPYNVSLFAVFLARGTAEYWIGWSNDLERLDKQLVERGLAQTRTRAQRLIEQGRVELEQAGGWQTQRKAGMKVSPDTPLRVLPSEEDRYVSRGGLKLQGALAQFGVNPEGWEALDVGQSTGGFTDCLLQAGARKVVGVDVGHDQLMASLRADPRVFAYEGINARRLPEAELRSHAPEGFDLIVMDVSFISQTLILPGLPTLLKPGGWLVSLVKPQFEVGKAGIGKGGIVRDTGLYQAVETRIRSLCADLALEVVDYFPSPITGGDGNREFFVAARKI